MPMPGPTPQLQYMLIPLRQTGAPCQGRAAWVSYHFLPGVNCGGDWTADNFPQQKQNAWGSALLSASSAPSSSSRRARGISHLVHQQLLCSWNHLKLTLPALLISHNKTYKKGSKGCPLLHHTRQCKGWQGSNKMYGLWVGRIPWPKNPAVEGYGTPRTGVQTTAIERIMII